MPARPASNSFRCNSRSRWMWARSSSSLRPPVKAATMEALSIGPRLVRIQSRARSRNECTSSTSWSTSWSTGPLLTGPLLLHGVHRDLLTVVGRSAQQHPVGGRPSQEEMQVVLEGHAYPPVDLYAVLDQLQAVLADEGLGHADQLTRLLRLVGHRLGRCVGDGVGRLEP